MTQIDFIVQKQGTTKSINDLVYGFVEQAFNEKKTLFIHTKNQQHAEEIDELLWTKDPYSFIPHNILGEGPNKAPNIQIGFGEQCGHQHHVLVNLAPTIPLYFSKFHQVYEFVPLQEELKQQARERYKFYKDRGYPLRHVEM